MVTEHDMNTYTPHQRYNLNMICVPNTDNDEQRTKGRN